MTINPNKKQLALKSMLLLTLLMFLPNFATLFAQGWEKAYPETGENLTSKIIPTTDGNYMLWGEYKNPTSGSPSANFIMKINPLGEVIWKKQLAPNLSGMIRNFVHNGDGTYSLAVSESTVINNNSYLQTVFVRIDESGNVIWEYSPYQNEPIDSYGQIYAPDTDGLNAIYLSNWDGMAQTSFVGKINNNGTLDFLNPIDTSLHGLAHIKNVEEGFYFRANIDTTTDLQLIEVSSIGEIVTAHNFPGIRNGGFLQMKAPGEFLIQLQDIFNLGTLQTIFDIQGNILSEKVIGEGLLYVDHPGTIVSDGILYAGSTDILDFSNPPDLVFIKADFQGNEIFTKIYDLRPDYQFGADAQNSHDGGFILRGVTCDVDLDNCQFYVLKLDASGNLYSNTISGTAALDTVANCEIDMGETVLESWLVTATKPGQTISTLTDNLGFYSVGVDTGNYEITLSTSLQSPYWQPCDNNVQVEFLDFDENETVDFPINALVDCPYLSVSFNLWSLRPCRNTGGFIRYCNYGTVTAEDAYIEMTFDPAITPQSSSIPWTNQVGNTYTFELGDLAPLECGTIGMQVLLDCDAEVGASYCIESHIFPDSLCIPDSSNWSGAFIEVSGDCETDNVNFQITNSGENPMTSHSDYIIVEDAILLLVDSVQLTDGEFLDIPFPSNGSTYTILAEQVDGAPGFSFPIAVVEGCGENSSGGISTGFSNQFELNDGNPFIDIECLIATNSYDPNDKVGVPLGYGPANKIEPNTPIEYTIRFQNTGTDTAFAVIIRDSLSEYLDIRTLDLGVSSHPYNLEISGPGYLNFNFTNIMLPDSNVNEPASNGFIKYKISPLADTPLKTEIKTDAAIYFDFNDPVITNETLHTIDVDFIEIGTWVQDVAARNIEVIAQPNPFEGQCMLLVKNHEAANYSLSLYSLDGRLLRQENHATNQIIFEQQQLPKGMYLYRIDDDKGLINSGKLIIQ